MSLDRRKPSNIMQTISTTKNWEIGTTPIVLHDIHQHYVNIVVYQRDIISLVDEVSSLLKQDIVFEASGGADVIFNKMTKTVNLDRCPNFLQDISMLLQLFREVTHRDSFRLLIETIQNDMCRKFHTDVNDLRMLCTYSGPGTLWVTKENIHPKGLRDSRNVHSLPPRASDVRQLETGDVAILKGAIYPNVNNAVVHRSPTIEKTGERRLLLRIDTNATQRL